MKKLLVLFLILSTLCMANFDETELYLEAYDFVVDETVYEYDLKWKADSDDVMKICFIIPTTCFSLQVEGNYVTQNGENIYDAEAGIRYTFDSGFGIESGYKLINLKFDELDNLNVENNFSGLYAKFVKEF